MRLRRERPTNHGPTVGQPEAEGRESRPQPQQKRPLTIERRDEVKYSIPQVSRTRNQPAILDDTCILHEKFTLVPALANLPRPVSQSIDRLVGQLVSTYTYPGRGRPSESDQNG
jgi:hypothetical protein